MTIDEFCRDLDTRLAATAAPEERLQAAAKAVAQVFSVGPDEIALYAVDPRLEVLQFLWPKKLRSAGTVPLTAHQSLVAKTARDKRPHAENAFANTPHLAIFERFRLDEGAGLPIQKIMSAPLLKDREVTGIIQVCRKGETREAAGGDFTPASLAVLARLADVISPHL